MANYQKTPPECWFSRLLQRKGEDYITSGRLTDTEVIRSASQIINDIINGRVDYSKYGNYLLMDIVFDNIRSYCDNEFTRANVEVFTLTYVQYACNIGQIRVANTSRIPSPKDDLSNVPYLLQYDASLWNQGFTTITPDMKTSIAVELRDAIVRYNKFEALIQALDRVKLTQNIYELQWAMINLKNYVYATNKFTT